MIPAATDAAQALAEVQPELRALAPSELRRVTANIPHAATIALGAVPALTALRPRIVRELPFHPIAPKGHKAPHPAPETVVKAD